MNLVLKLSTLALRYSVDGACKAVGVYDAVEAARRIKKILDEHFKDHSQLLTAALRNANDRAWKALELSLVGDSLWERCKAATARTEDKAFAQQVRTFLDTARLPESFAEPAFRQKCLQELRAARKAELLTTGVLHPQELAEQAAAFARFSDPQSLIDGEGQIITGMARELEQAGYGNLALLITQHPGDGRPLLVIAARYFFRRTVEEDAKLFQGLAFAQLERLDKEQEEGFASLHALLSQQGKRLEDMLADVHAVVIETHSAVLDLQGQIEGQSGQLQEIGVAVQKLLEQHQLHRREVRPSDSLSIRNDNERQLVKQLVARYRALPEVERRQVPALLNGIGKLEVVAGDFDAARKDFAAVATLVEDNKLQAEAHFNAYQACLERRDWPAAIQEFIKAVKLDAKRFASFPVGKYHPQRILGAGGFGVAFLCKHKYMDAQVVVKTLMLEDLGRDADKVFMEAKVLRQLDHPAIIRISDCGYVDSANRSRPFLVMDYFEGGTLEEYVKKHGPLSVEDLLVVARPVAEGLQAAHGKDILHRDVKPANLLVRKDGANWQAKVIDFGLAMRQKVVKTSMNASTFKRKKSLVGESIAGTLDYAAPEQMGKRDESIGPYSDIYGWAKTCCYALFQTTQPLMKHWKGVPEQLAELLEKCLDEAPKNRPQSFADVLEELRKSWMQPRRYPVLQEAWRQIDESLPQKEEEQQRIEQEGERKRREDEARLEQEARLEEERKRSARQQTLSIAGGVSAFGFMIVLCFGCCGGCLNPFRPPVPTKPYSASDSFPTLAQKPATTETVPTTRRQSDPFPTPTTRRKGKGLRGGSISPPPIPTPQPTVPSELAKKLLGRWRQKENNRVAVIKFKGNRFECRKDFSPAMPLTDGKIGERAGSYRFVAKDQIELTESKGKKCILDVLFDNDNDYEVTFTLHGGKGFKDFGEDYYGRFYRTGTLVLRHPTPIARGFSVWVEADGKRIADWQGGTSEVEMEIPAGKHRVRVYYQRTALQILKVFDQDIEIKPDAKTTADVKP